MEAITQYRAEDGSIFSSMVECAKYETLAKRVALAMQPLGESPQLRMGEWVQLDRQACLSAKRGLLVLIRERWKESDYAVLRNPDDEIHPMSFVGRLVCDCGIRCLERAWCRLMRINWDNYREYDQPYYANHPEEAENESV